MSQTQLLPQFSELYRKHLALRESYHNGKIDKATFLAQVQTQVVQDRDGKSWWLDETGDWHWHNGSEWVPDEPPKEVQPPVKSEKSSFKKKKAAWLYIAIPTIAIFLCLCLILVIALGGLAFFKDEMFRLVNPATLDSDLDRETSLPMVPPFDQSGQISEADLVFVLSEHQKIVYEEFDWPDSFMIMEVDDITGKQVRLETWDYYGGKTSFTFSDGDFLVDGETETLPTGFLPTPFHPDMFILGSSFEDIQALLALYPLIPLGSSPSLQEGVEIYSGQQLILGFLNDHLFYVDAMAFVPEGIE